MTFKFSKQIVYAKWNSQCHSEVKSQKLKIKSLRSPSLSKPCRYNWRMDVHSAFFLVAMLCTRSTRYKALTQMKVKGQRSRWPLAATLQEVKTWCECYVHW